MLEFVKSTVRNVIEAHFAGDCVGYLMRMQADRDLWGLYWNGTDSPFAILELRRAKDYMQEAWNERKPKLWDQVQAIANSLTS